MVKSQTRAGVFPALLKHWRGKRGLSQLDLALAADVSSRHVSFLETARSTPSPAMVHRLAAALDVPLRHINEMLKAAGYEPAYPEPGPQEALPPEVARALELMMTHHNPYPLVVLNRTYDIVDLNAGAQALFSAALPDLDLGGGSPINLARLTFDPEGAQPALANFEEVGRALLWRLHREVLASPDDGLLRALLDDILAMPTVAEGWRDADLTVASSPAVLVHLRAAGLELKFLTMVTALQAPQTVTLDELRIETWFPTDDDTAAICQGLVGAGLHG